MLVNLAVSDVLCVSCSNSQAPVCLDSYSKYVADCKVCFISSMLFSAPSSYYYFTSPYENLRTFELFTVLSVGTKFHSQ